MPLDLPVIFFSSQCGEPAWSSECNCACPTLGATGFTSSRNIDQRFFQKSDAFLYNLSPDFTLIFNPIYGQETAVLNKPATLLWTKFGTSRSLEGLNDHDYRIAQLMIRSGLLEPVESQANPCRSVSDTLSAWLHITNSCNLRCSYCYVSKSNENMSLETGLAAVDAIFRSALKGKYQKISLKFSGGEPTLHLDLVYRIHAYAAAKAAQENLELDAVILSNGTALDDNTLTAIRSHGLRLMLSLDGIGDAHDVQRSFPDGRGSFKKAWGTLELAAAKGMKPFVSITITEGSANSLPDLVSCLLILGLPFNLNFARPSIGKRVFDNEKVILALRETFHRIEANLPPYSLLGSLLDRASFTYPHERPCGVGESYLVINQKGHIAKCQMRLDDAVTDIHADDPLAIIRSESEANNPSVDSKEECRQCKWRYICAGGCPFTAFRAKGRYDTSSPFCEIYKTIFPELICLEGKRVMNWGLQKCYTQTA